MELIAELAAMKAVTGMREDTAKQVSQAIRLHEAECVIHTVKADVDDLSTSRKGLRTFIVDKVLGPAIACAVALGVTWMITRGGT